MKLRVLIAAAAAVVVPLTMSSAPAQPQSMNCADGFEAICIAIGTTCQVLDIADEKILKKDLINCQLG
jgi:hypothetical protein